MIENFIMQNDKTSNACFKSEVQSLEFTEALGNLKTNITVDPQKRDKKLIAIGKRMFKKHPQKRKIIFKITIHEVTRLLSQAEIDDLLTDNKRKVKFDKRELLIHFMGKSYTLDFLKKYLTNKDFRNNNIDKLPGVLSQEEIDYLLKGIGKE